MSNSSQTSAVPREVLSAALSGWKRQAALRTFDPVAASVPLLDACIIRLVLLMGSNKLNRQLLSQFGGITP
jgi:hypothetical protein